MKDYASMSDFEINCRVHAEVMEISGLDSFKAKDYCNNPEDAWPIILQNRISVIFDSSDESDESEESDEWVKACVGGEEYFISYHYCHRALRAAMVAFLMMKDGEK